MKIGANTITNCKIGNVQVKEVRIGSTLVWSGFDADAQLFITNAAITDPTQQTAVNNLVVALKGYGIWSKMKALYPFVGGTASQHKFNLKNPLDTDAAFRLVFSGGLTHSSTGVKFLGVNGFADTKLKPFLDLTNNFAHHSLYTKETLSDLSGFGVITNSFANRMDILSLSNFLFNAIGIGSPAQNSYSPPPFDGFIIGSRITNISNKLYTKGVLRNSNNSTNTATLPNDNYYLGFIKNTGLNYLNNEIRFSSIGDGLTDTEASNYYTAVQNFQVTLNRQV